MISDTTPHPSGNEDPDAVSTATEGFNEPLTEAELDILTKLMASARPALFQRVSKHRGGRTPKMTSDQKRKRDRAQRLATQARKHVYLEHQADLRALLNALND